MGEERISLRVLLDSLLSKSGIIAVWNVRIIVLVSRLTPSLVKVNLRAFVTCWSASPSIMSSMDTPARVGASNYTLRCV